MRNLNSPYLRSGTIAGVLLALAILGIVSLVQGKQAKNQVGTLREQIRVVEARNPCNDLTTRECARKLFRSLPPVERRQIERRVIAEERRIERVARRRERERSQTENPQENSRRPSSGTRDQPRRPNRPGNGSENDSGGSVNRPENPSPTPAPPVSTPHPQPEPTPTAVRPIIRVPEIDVPPVGPVDIPPIPPIEIPCVKVPPLIKCG